MTNPPTTDLDGIRLKWFTIGIITQAILSPICAPYAKHFFDWVVS